MIASVEDLFGFNSTNPLPSCFGLFLTETASNLLGGLDPTSPSAVSTAAGSAYWYQRLSSFNSAMDYATVRQLPYALKSSVFRNRIGWGKLGLKNARIAAAKAAMLAAFDVAMAQALWTEYQTSYKGQCQ